MTDNRSFDAFQIYRALKFHFTQKNYDFKSFNAKTANCVEYWNKKEFGPIFSLYANKFSQKTLRDLFIANFLENTDYFPTNLEREQEIYNKWLGRINSVRYNYKNDLTKIKKFLLLKQLKFKDLINPKNGKLPIILYMVFKKIIQLESFIILDTIFDILGRCNESISSDTRLLYDNRLLAIKKYKSFFIIKNIHEYKVFLKNEFI